MSGDLLTVAFVVNAVILIVVARETESIIAVALSAGFNAWLLAELIQRAGAR